MLHLLDSGLESYLRAETPLRRDEVDVVFVAPAREWAATVDRPTVNLFLWDVVRSTKHARSGTEVIERDGQLLHRPVLPCFELRYLVTAWTTDVRDEHQLLGAILATLAGTDRLPPAHLPSPLDEVHPLPILNVGTHPDGDRHELWSAVGGQLKPALDLTVAASVDPGLTIPLAPPVAAVRLAVRESAAPEEPDTGADGLPVTQAPKRDRRWRLRRLRGGQAPDAVVLQPDSTEPQSLDGPTAR